MYKTKNGDIVEGIEICVYSTEGKCLFSDILPKETTEKILSGGGVKSFWTAQIL